ncbi:hypothetical protein O0544_02330 [Edwardsiella anguillarum]|nr:hypothetical protein [Edwardsiella anguillarum]
MANSLLAGANNQARARGTTQSAIADGAIVVRDRANQQQDVAGLARDTERAHQPLSLSSTRRKRSGACSRASCSVRLAIRWPILHEQRARSPGKKPGVTQRPWIRRAPRWRPAVSRLPSGM